MFKRLIFWYNSRQIYKVWNSTPKKTTINELIAAGPALQLRSLKRQSFVFKNNYVRADALIISCVYTTKALQLSGAPHKIISDLEQKFLALIQSECSVFGLELQKMQENRFPFFRKLLDEHVVDINPVLEEAALLFAHDMHHNKYVQYESTSPLVIMGIDKQMQLEYETRFFFKTAIETMNHYIELYFKKN